MDYSFPLPDICEKTNEALFALIERHLPTATDMVDGTGFTTDVHIDYAQDVIAQARDMLVSRGVTISAHLREQLSFLDWRTPAEKAAEEALVAAENAARYAAVKQAGERLAPMAAAFRQEAESYLLPRRPRLSMRLDEAYPGLRIEVAVPNSTGAHYMETKRRFEKFFGNTMGTSHFAYPAGFELQEHPNVSFTLYLPVLSDGRFYAMVRNLVCSAPLASVTIHLAGDEFNAWETVTEPFETQWRNPLKQGAFETLFEVDVLAA